MESFRPRDCKNALQLLDDFIADELSVESNRALLMHFEACESCRREKEARELLRGEVQRRWQEQPVPRGMEDRLRQSLESRQSPRWHFAAGLAAAVILGAVALFLALPFGSNSSVAVDHYFHAIEDHLRCDKADESHALQTPISEEHRQQMELVLRDLPGDFHLHAAHLCKFEEVRFVHYRFKGSHGQSLSLILEARGQDERLAELAKSVRSNVEGVPVKVITREETSLLAFESDQHFVYLVLGDTDRERTLNIARNLLPSIKDSLFRNL